MRRTPLCLPILILVLFVLPSGAGALDREIRLPPTTEWNIRLVCYAGEFLEVAISVVSAHHVNTGEESEVLGVDFSILRHYDDPYPFFTRTNVRSHTWSTSLDEDVSFLLLITNSNRYYEIVVQLSTETSPIRYVILTNLMILSVPITLVVIVLMGFRRFRHSKYWTPTKRKDDQEGGPEPTSYVRVPFTDLLKSRINILWNRLRKRSIVTDSDDAE